MNINIIEKNIIKDSIEKYIIKKLNKKPPNIYTFMNEEELNYIHDSIKKKFNITIDKNIILSIRSSYTKNHIINSSSKINKKSVIQDYNNITILKLCKKYDIPPLNILRIVFMEKYKMKLDKMLINKNILTYDKEQLDRAMKYDKYTNLDNMISQRKAREFEIKIEDFLKKNNVKYIDQGELVKQQIKSHGYAFNTPDFLILSDLYINNFKINWIDAKNYYGSNINFDVKLIKKQVGKYISKYGSGCIIFNLGYNEILFIDKVLFLATL